ncbi:MAG: hypothetical protein DMG14_16450 [Acidobacteria bacterium]|nr:MAG: hypothetical protein DMG14_16450 [Acidobacteriota bacterium]
MGGPFPGMDPWLEEPSLWSGVHASLIIYIRDQLQPQLRPRYIAAVEERVYVATADRMVIPDVSVRRGRKDEPAPSVTAVLQPDEPVVVEVVEDEVHEPYLHIIDPHSGEQIVTVIEVLSPSNKVKGEGRDLYLAKQQQVLSSEANLVEIDLLRSGPYALGVPEADAQQVGRYDYLVAVSRARDRHKRFFLYPRLVRDPLPRLAIPLRPTDADVILDLQPLLDRVYDIGGYEDRIDYGKPCIPRLQTDDEVWAQELIRSWQAARHA